MRRLSLTAILTAAFTATAFGQSALELQPSTTGPIQIGGFQAIVCAAGFAEESVPVDLTATSAQSVAISIECNAPFLLDASADNGQLRNTAEYAPNDPLTFVTYTVSWPPLVSYDGQTIAPNFTNSGENWAGGLSASSPPTGSRQDGVMTVQWGPSPAVIAGEYTDTFELNIVAN